MKRARPKPRAQEIQRLEEALRAHGLPVTLQRRIVLEAMLDREDHPSAETVFQDVRRIHPEVGRATVYRTLEKLVEIGLLRKVCHPGAVVRYDPRFERHHHLICLRCNRMADFSDPRLDRISLPAVRGQGFEVQDYSIQFRGICDDCRRRLATGSTAKRKQKPKTQG